MLRLLGSVAMFAAAAVAANAFTPESGLSQDEQTARTINTSGFICTDIVSMEPGISETVLNVRCVQFYDGTGRAHFAVDTVNGMVMRTY